MTTRNVNIFYHPKLNYTDDTVQNSYSGSPQKPAKYIDYLKRHDLLHYVNIIDHFLPFDKAEFYIAHHQKWVDDFFAGTGKLQRKNLLGISWSPNYAESVTYTNACLYYAIKQSITTPPLPPVCNWWEI